MADTTFQKHEKVWYCKDKIYHAEIKAIHCDDNTPYYTIYIPHTKLEKQTIKSRLFKIDNLYEAVKYILN